MPNLEVRSLKVLQVSLRKAIQQNKGFESLNVGLRSNTKRINLFCLRLCTIPRLDARVTFRLCLLRLEVLRVLSIGIAHTFFSGATDKARSGELINVLKEAGQPVPPELLKFGVTTKKKESKLYGAHFKDIDHTVKATKITFDD